MYQLEESRSGYYFLKRTMDIACSLMGLIMLSPIFLIVGIAIRLESKDDVIIPKYINIENLTNE